MPCIARSSILRRVLLGTSDKFLAQLRGNNRLQGMIAPKGRGLWQVRTNGEHENISLWGVEVSERSVEALHVLYVFQVGGPSKHSRIHVCIHEVEMYVQGLQVEYRKGNSLSGSRVLVT